MPPRLNPEVQAALDAVRRRVRPEVVVVANMNNDDGRRFNPGMSVETTGALDAILAALENLDARLKALEGERAKR